MTAQPVALVTGGTRGIGLGIALKLAESGFRLVLSGRRDASDIQPALDEVARAGNGEPPLYVQSDVASAEGRASLLAAVEQATGRLDLLVNNAGIAPPVRADLLEATEASFDLVLSTNLRGPYFLTQAVAAWMIRQQTTLPSRRAIINISSVSATVPSINRGDYCLSKAAIAMATRLWAVRLAPHGIGVYEVRPGIIATDMTEGVQAKYNALIGGGLLLEPRWGTPADVGAAVAMLARGDLPYAPGAVLIVDGGLTMPRL